MKILHLKSLAQLLPELIRTLFAPKSTVQFPFGPLEPPAHHRGKLKFDADRCRGCGICARDCPAFALELEREGREEFRLIYYQDRCVYCGQCERSCSHDVIDLSEEFVSIAVRREPSPEVVVERRGECEEEPASV